MIMTAAEVVLPVVNLLVIDIEVELQDVEDQQVLEERRRKRKEPAEGSARKRKATSEGVEESESEKENFQPNWKIKVGESCNNLESAQDFFFNFLPPADMEKVKNLSNIDCVQSFMDRRAEQEKNKEELGELHIANDKAKSEKLKAKHATVKKVAMEANEKAAREQEAREKWEAEAKRITEWYENLNGEINAATEKTVLETFLNDKTCGNLFTRISKPVAREAFKYLCERIQQDIEPTFKLSADLAKIAEVAKTNVYPCNGGEFNFEELIEAYLMKRKRRR